MDAPRHYVLNGNASKVAFFDVDDDGESDLLFSGFYEDTILPGRGDGTFQGVGALSTSANPSALSTASGAAVADFTGDGLPDVAVANGRGGGVTAILPGLGAGKFGSPVAIPGQIGHSVVSGDWNGDTLPDLAFVGQGANSQLLMIAPGLGGGAFGPYSITVLPGRADLPPSASLDQDAFPDLLVGNVAPTDVSVFLGNGVGDFTAQASVKIGDTPVTFSVLPPSLAVGDFNEDTHPDLVVAYEGQFEQLNGGLKIALGNGDGTFKAPQTLRDSIAAIGVAAADFNRDGNLDLALAMEHAGWDVAIYLGRGDGSFAAPAPLGLKEGSLSFLKGVIVLDGDRDGKPDLGLPVGDEVLGLRGLGDGTFAPFIRAPIGGGAVMTADLNQDGWPDLLAPNDYIGLYINELPALGLQNPILGIGLAAADKVALRWPAFFGDYTLSESSDLRAPFAPSTRAITTEDGFFKADVNASEVESGFFRLEPK